MTRKAFSTLAIISFTILAGSWAAGALTSITFKPRAPKVGETVEFTIGLANKEKAIVVKWDFGDGIKKEKTEATPVTHSYDEAGTYTVEVTVMIGNENHEDVTSITIAE